MLWEKILNALLHEIENNPERVFDILENIVKLLQDNPDAVKALIPVIAKRLAPKEN